MILIITITTIIIVTMLILLPLLLLLLMIIGLIIPNFKYLCNLYSLVSVVWHIVLLRSQKSKIDITFNQTHAVDT